MNLNIKLYTITPVYIYICPTVTHARVVVLGPHEGLENVQMYPYSLYVYHVMYENLSAVKQILIIFTIVPRGKVKPLRLKRE